MARDMVRNIKKLICPLHSMRIVIAPRNIHAYHSAICLYKEYKYTSWCGRVSCNLQATKFVFHTRRFAGDVYSGDLTPSGADSTGVSSDSCIGFICLAEKELNLLFTTQYDLIPTCFTLSSDPILQIANSPARVY